MPYNLPCLFFFWNCPIDHPFYLPRRNWSSCTNFFTLPTMFAKCECKWWHAQIQYSYSALYYNQLLLYLGIPYPIIQNFYFGDMIGIAPLPRDDDKALLSPEEKRKVDLKFHFNRNMATSPSTCNMQLPLKPSQQDAM